MSVRVKRRVSLGLLFDRALIISACFVFWRCIQPNKGAINQMTMDSLPPSEPWGLGPGAWGLRAVVHFVWFSLVCVHIYRCEGLIIMSRMLNAVLYSVLVMCVIREQSAKWVFVSTETRLSPTVVHNWNGLQRWRTTWHWQLKSQNTDLMWSYPFQSGQKQWFKTTLCSYLCFVRWRQTDYWPWTIVFCIFWFKKVILPLMPHPLRQCPKHNSLIGKMS